MNQLVKSDTELDAVRRRIVERISTLNLTLAGVSRLMGRNVTYLHQFVYRGTPRKLPEDDRARLALLLDLPEWKLRPEGKPVITETKSDARDFPPLNTASAPQGVPVYTERDTIDAAQVIEWIPHPSLLGSTGPVFALWIARDHGSRLRAGELAFVNMTQPPRPGDMVVVLQAKRIVCIGELVAIDHSSVSVNDGSLDVREFAVPDCTALKVTSIVLP